MGLNTTVFFPVHPLKERWDALVMVLILYSAAIVPYRVCFDVEAEGALWVFEAAMSIFFLVDVVFQQRPISAFACASLWVVVGVSADNIFVVHETWQQANAEAAPTQDGLR